MFKTCKYTVSMPLTWLLMATSALAQITPDTTLPNNSKVTSEGTIDRLTEGTTQGNNLFHSFLQFSVETGRTAFFDNALNIENIFTRVTGNSLSNIDGMIRANGTANLFLLNPNGIIFGKNASLNIGGSFIGSTANSIKFNNGKEFSATNPQTQPLLNVNLPTALQFTSNPSDITVQGQGFTEIKDKPPIITAEGLKVKSGKTLALIGGNIELTRGYLEAKEGKVELGSIQSPAKVTFDIDKNWTFDYKDVANFSNITLTSAALINTTGDRGGDVHLQGNQILFQDGSGIKSLTTGSGIGGIVEITAIESLELTGPERSGILSETYGSGDGGNITVDTNKLVLKDRAQLSSTSFSSGNAGNITIKSPNIELSNKDTRIVTSAKDIGNGGNITINTNQLTIQDSAAISADSSGKGTVEPKKVNGGNGGTITIEGLNPETPSELIKISKLGTLSSITSGTGNGGNLEIKTRNLTLETGSQISNGTSGSSGNGGNITINSDSVLLTDKTDKISGIFASSINGSTGKGGTIEIHTNTLDIKKDAQIGVGNFTSKDPNGTNLTTVGTGIPGNITITANSLNLDNGQIVAKAYLANGGDIKLTVNDISTLSNHGIISATAGNNQNPGNGGNVDFTSPFIIASRASEITAEAYKGDGGKITFTTSKGYLVIDSKISASSKFGTDGAVEIKNPNINPVEGLIERQNFVYPKQLAVGCNDQVGIAEGSLTYIGKGGIAQLSTDDFSGDTVLDDLRPVPTNKVDENIPVTIPTEKPAFKPIREAQGWRWKDDKKDTVIFISNPIEINQQSSSSNPILCRDLKNHPS